MKGDILQEINRQKIASVSDFEAVVSAIKPGKDILLLIFRGASSLYITLSNQ
jgi:S1-C subfamily serine protease